MSQAPALKKRKVKRKESKRQEEDSADNSSEQPGPVRKKRHSPSDLRQEEASALHDKAWGKPWPQSKGTISKTEISGDETGPVDDDAFADTLDVPPNFKYRYLEEIRSLKSALGVNPGEDEEDFLVVRHEYKMLRKGLEKESKFKRAIVVTGHPGIGSYETWF
jgi:hypothetical protein